MLLSVNRLNNMSRSHGIFEVKPSSFSTFSSFAFSRMALKPHDSRDEEEREMMTHSTVDNQP